MLLVTAPELLAVTGRFFDQTDEVPIRLPDALRKAVMRETVKMTSLHS